MEEVSLSDREVRAVSALLDEEDKETEVIHDVRRRFGQPNPTVVEFSVGRCVTRAGECV